MGSGGVVPGILIHCVRLRWVVIIPCPLNSSSYLLFKELYEMMLCVYYDSLPYFPPLVLLLLCLPSSLILFFMSCQAARQLWSDITFCSMKLLIVTCKWRNLIQYRNVDTRFTLYKGLAGHTTVESCIQRCCCCCFHFRSLHVFMLLIGCR
jgi:hypothetical protein